LNINHRVPYCGGVA